MSTITVNENMPTDKRFTNLTGQSFTRWTVVGFAGRSNGKLKWVCRCECGNVKEVDRTGLVSGKSKSCGCLNEELKKSRIKHGHSRGGHESPEFATFCSMNARCNNPNSKDYEDYGGRGIKIAEEWRGENGFARFLKHVGVRPSPLHSIERINVNGDYEPGNVKWATPQEQARNRRNNRRLSLNGKTMLLCEWAELLGIKYSTLHQRSAMGWSDEEILTTPLLRVHKRQGAA